MHRNQKRHLLLQYTAAIATSITAIGFVCAYAWPSPSLPYLTGKKSEFPVSKYQSSWIASLYPVGLIIGYLLNPLFIDRIGRKGTLMMFSLPQIASWLLIILAKNYVNLYIARIIGGIGYGGGISSSTVYISEIGDLKNRGVFLVFFKFMMNLGFLFTMLLGAFLSYKNMNLVLLMLPLSFFVIFIFMPDSSYFWEINQKNEKEVMMRLNPLAEKEEREEFNLKMEEESETKNSGNNNFGTNNLGISNLDTSNFGTSNFDTSNFGTRNLGINNFQHSKLFTSNFEVNKLGTSNFKANIDDKTKNSKTRIFNIKKSILWKLFAFSNHRKALEITLYMGLTNILSGHAGITTFTQQIFTYEGSFVAPEKATVILATATAIFSLISTQFVERIRRKVLLLSTGIIATISLALVGMFFFFKEKKMDVEFLDWLPLFGITSYDVMLSCGLGNLFYIYQGELFANEIKSEAIAFNKISYMAFSFLFLLQFQNFIDAVGTYTSFWVFTIGIIFGTLGVYVLAPETKGKSLQEIQVLLK